ncbi:MAG: glycosyltransferase family 4 protein [Patescibacteria group bacterium]|nr:glycosyltransferase family 4 protein [Patescibacteria group bacterium]
MKIAQVVCVYPPYKSGIGAVAKKFHKTLTAVGHKSNVFCPADNESTREEKNIKHLKPLLRSGNGVFLPQLIFVLRSYDIVHLHYPFFGGSEALLLAKVMLRQNFTLALHFHMEAGKLSPLNGLLKIPDIITRPLLWQQASAITCASLDYAENMESHKKLYKKHKKKYHEIPFSVDTGFFCPPSSKKTTNLKILFVGGMDKAHYFKGVPILLQALEKIKELNWSLQLVGDGELKKDYQDLAKKLKINKKINFLGNLNDDGLKKIYQANNLLILPSTDSSEAFGIVLLEAMASGLAVIASRLPGVRTVFKDGLEGIYFETKDTHDLSLKIKKIINNPNMLKQMSKNARLGTLERYDDKIISQKLISFYENLHNK